MAINDTARPTQRTLDKNVADRADATKAPDNARLVDDMVDLTCEILSLSNRDDVVLAVLRKACALLHTEHAFVDLISLDGTVMVDHAALGIFETNERLETRKGEGLVGHIWAASEPLLVADYVCWPGRLNRSELSPLRAVIGVPIIADSAVIGVMGLAHTDPEGTFLPEHLELLVRLSALTASVVSSIERDRQVRNERDAAHALSRQMNASLLDSRSEIDLRTQRLNRQNALLAALNDTTVNLLKHEDLETLLSGVMAHAKSLTGAKHAFVGMVSPDGSVIRDVGGSVIENNWLVASKRGEGMKGKVWETGKTMVVDNYAEWPGRMADKELGQLRATAVAPLKSGDEVTGCIGIADVDPSVRYSPDDIEILNRLAEIASLVCDRTRLLASERRNREVAEGLTEVLSVVNSPRSLTSVLTFILERSMALLKSDIGIMFRLDTDRRTLTISATRGFANADANNFTVLVPDASFVSAKRYRDKSLVLPARLARAIIAKVQRDPHWRESLGPTIDELGCAIVAQLAVDGAIVGGMLIASRDNRNYTAEDRQVFHALATHASLAIQSTLLRVQSIELAAQEERARLARELHDSVSQALFGIALGINTAKSMADIDPKTIHEPLNYALSLSQAAIAEMRALIYQLQPDLLERHGLRGILEMQATALRNRHQVSVSLDGDLREPPLRIDLKEALYRAISEALHNVVKHARATDVHVITEFAPGAYVITVVDDGVGFEQSAASLSSFGLRMMRERMERFNGTVTVTSAQGCGTSITIRVPFA